MEDIDFKVPVSRDQLYSLVSDTWERVNKPVQMALDTAAMTMDSIDQVNRKQIIYYFGIHSRTTDTKFNKMQNVFEPRRL